MSSSSFSCIAALSRFCEFWIRNTIRKVTMVVPVLITNCQVSDQWNSGPVTPQTSTTLSASRKVAGWPAQPAIHEAIRVKILSMRAERPPCWLVPGRSFPGGGLSGLLVLEREGGIAFVGIDVLPVLLR